MAIVTGNDYDHIDIVNGSTQTRHMIKDASARADVADLKSAFEDTDILPITYSGYIKKGYISTSSPYSWSGMTSSSYSCCILPVTPGSSVKVVSNSSYGTMIAALTAYIEPSNGDIPSFSSGTGWTSIISIGSNNRAGTFTGTLPSDVKYLYINMGNPGSTPKYSRLPSLVEIGSYVYTKSLYDNINAINREIDNDETRMDGIEAAFLALLSSKANRITATSSSHADYNSYTNAGNYYVDSSEITGWIDHKPEELTVAHRLFVISTTSTELITQIIISNGSTVNIYKRFYNGSEWGTWTKVTDNTTSPLVVKSANTTAISSGEDLNDYTTPGNYKIESSTIGGNVDNMPDGVTSGGRLTVMGLGADSLLMQIYQRQDASTGIYVRYCKPETSTYSAWRRIITNNILDERLINDFGSNFAPYYTLEKSKFSVGSLDSNGDYDDSVTYRICTPDIQIALTDVRIRPLDGYRIELRKYTNGSVTTVTPSLSGAKLTVGQQYKIIIKRSVEDTSETVTVNLLYDKARFQNTIQQIDEVSIHSDPQYIYTDYGIVPQGVFYPGVTDEYDAFNYDTLAQTVYDAFDALVSANAKYITKTDLGLCSDGVQHVYMYDFNPVQSDTTFYNATAHPKLSSVGQVLCEIPTIFLLCGQHGYEKSSTYSAYYLLKHMIAEPSENPVINYLRNHVRIVCVPIANPYGWNEKTYKNYNGVNLNRNWGSTGWGTGPNENDPDSKDYAGSAAFDQPETAAIRDAFLAIKYRINLAIDYHTNGHVSISTQNTDYRNMNWILYKNRVIPIWLNAKKAVRYYIKDISSHFKSQYSLQIADDEPCAGTILNHDHYGQAQQWFDEQDRIAFTFETFAGFPGQETYTGDVIKAAEQQISNFIITVLNYIK